MVGRGIVDPIRTYLVDSQNPDGGWGYRRGVPSNTEMTSLGLLATSSWAAQVAAHASRWLLGSQRADGGWPVAPGIPRSSWPTALALLALSEATAPAQLRAGARWLVAEQGQGSRWTTRLYFRLFPSRNTVDLDPDLIGWPWASGTFSWVEPTAYALLALKSLRSLLSADAAAGELDRVEARIAEAEAMLLDRVCDGGGWNYGNTLVLGEELWPYPDTTALGLLAMQGVQGRLEIEESVIALERMVETQTSGLNLALAVLSLQVYGRDVTRWRERLAARWLETGFVGETRAIALASLALEETRQPLRILSDD